MHQTILFALLLLSAVTKAQVIRGKVVNAANEPLAGAIISWLGSANGTRAGETGEFEIALINQPIKKLIASHVGFLPDTVEITDKTFIQFQLKQPKTMSEVIVRSQPAGVIISDKLTIKTEQITQTELRKAACCDLAGCFETQTTVQPQTTNVITNSKELRILGLSGVYNQILIDGFPLIQGLTYTYGISSIPGTVVDNIYVAKGANSVLQGFESMSGQINIETKDPDQTDKLLLNTYMNNFQEKHVNANYAFQKGKWSNLTAFHTVQPAKKIDRDKDNFLDVPQLTRYLLSNKWKYGNEEDWGWSSRIGLRILNEKRVGGQTDFNPKQDKGSTDVYGQNVQIDQGEWWTKSAYRFNDKHNITLFISMFRQQQNSYFGSVKYDARQTNLYTNLQYEFTYGPHDLKTGISYRSLRLNENIDFTDAFLGRTYDGNYKRLESIPGVFAENTLRLLNDKITWIIGIRGDQHNQFGFQFTPRTTFKYDINPKTILRANIGTGWRTVNLFSENIGLLASSRNIQFAEPLDPERALNMGINFTQKFETRDKILTGFISVDYYRTAFQNQIFPDYDTDPTLAIIKNFRGTSRSNGFQADLNLKFYQRVEWKAGYNFLDVYRMINGEKQLLPFNARHKFLTSVNYKPLTNRFQFDMNLHLYGKQRLPDTRSNPTGLQRPDFSRSYSTLNTQFTYNFKKLEVYVGCENIFDFRQLQPIISWENPFSPFFDTSSVWGPTRGREVYLGARFKLTNP